MLHFITFLAYGVLVVLGTAIEQLRNLFQSMLPFFDESRRVFLARLDMGIRLRQLWRQYRKQRYLYDIYHAEQSAYDELERNYDQKRHEIIDAATASIMGITVAEATARRLYNGEQWIVFGKNMAFMFAIIFGIIAIVKTIGYFTGIN